MKERLLKLLPVGALAILTGILFWPTLSFRFLNWDDMPLLTQHPWFHPLTWRSVLEIWNPLSLWNGTALDYSPVRDVSYALDYLVFGWNPAEFHFTNWALHVLNACLAYGLLKAFVRPSFAWLGAALWAWHPLVVEPVAWVSGRKDLLVMAFSLGSCLLYLREKPKRAWILAIAALLSKYTAVILAPLVWVLLRERGKKVPGTNLLSLFGASLCLGVYVVIANHHLGALVKHSTLADTASVWPAAFQTFHHAVQTVLAPLNLSARYVQHPEWGFGRPEVWLGILLCAAWTAAAWAARKRDARIRAGVLWIGLTYLPYVASICAGHPIWMADRYLYMPLLGAGLIVAALLDSIPMARSAVWSLGLGVALALGWGAHVRLPVWSDSLTLWQDTVRKSPSLYYVWSNLGEAQMDAGRLVEARRSFLRASKLNPAQDLSALRLAQVEVQAGNPDIARRILIALEARKTVFDEETSLRDLGILWAQLKDEGKGERLLRDYLSRRPHDPAAWVNLGVLLAATKRDTEALDAWNRALDLDPEDQAARMNRARYWYFHGECLRMNEDLTAAASSTADALAETGKMKSTCRAR
ncbi:MAG: tetratricopeptide repeat protein [Pseudomonadota bacterium]